MFTSFILIFRSNTIIIVWYYVVVCCNYLLIYEYVIGNQSNNPWKNIARAFATRTLEKAVDELDDDYSGRSTPRKPPVNKTQDRTLLLGG